MTNRANLDNSSSVKGGKFFSAFCSVFGTAGIILIIIMCLPVTLPRFFGVNIFNVVSGSMEPAIPVGSIVYVSPIDPEVVSPGDVIAFGKNGIVITHRVMENDLVNKQFITKGDANIDIDFEPVSFRNVIGKVTITFPFLGAFSDFFTTIKGKLILFGLLVGFFIIMMIGSSLKERIKKQDSDGKKLDKSENNTNDAIEDNEVESDIAKDDDESETTNQEAKSENSETSDQEAKSENSETSDHEAEEVNEEESRDESAERKKAIARDIRVVLFIIAGAILLGSVAYIVYTLMGYQKEASVYDNAADTFISDSNTGVNAAPTIDKEENEIVKDSEDIILPPITVDFEVLMAENPDVCGWIYCEDSEINYPILKADNNDYYLHHNYLGQYTAAGSIFVECANTDNFVDSNTIIYGHHMKDGSMFASLSKWASQEYYEEHPVMWLLTPEQNYRIDLFSEYTTSATSDSYCAILSPCQELNDYVYKAKEKSNFKSEVTLEEDAKYVMLSTCAYSYENARSVLHGKLVPVGMAN